VRSASVPGAAPSRLLTGRGWEGRGPAVPAERCTSTAAAGEEGAEHVEVHRRSYGEVGRGVGACYPYTRMVKRRRPPIAVDLFAGAGGLGEGLMASGFRVAVASERHPQAALTYAFNHPTTTVFFGDVGELSSKLIGDAVEARYHTREVDLVAGGPPCQGFSTAGKKLASDPRNNLFLQFVRVAADLRPRLILLENVPGFQRMHSGRAFSETRRLFNELGYEVASSIVNASHYGVPQGRERFVMVGWRRGALGGFEWPPQTHGRDDGAQLSLLAPKHSRVTTVLDALEDLAFLEPGWEAHHHQRDPLSAYAKARRSNCDLLFNHLATRHRARAEHMLSLIPEGRTIAAVPSEFRSAKRTMARLDRNDLSNAVLALPDDLIHYRHNRIPTVREMARLQSFDDDYIFIGKRTSGFIERRVDVPQYTQVGNAVPPLMARALGIALLTALGAPFEDARELAQRRERHAWVRGSSGFAGYTFDPTAQDKVDLRDVCGELARLPTSTEDVPVDRAPALFEWKTQTKPPRRGQWMPGVTPRPVPAHVRHAEESL
jgi:DNA (cytosine-5)-methyltransferase 1